MNIYYNRNRVRKITLIISVVLFAVSLTQKCYCTDHSCADSIAVLFSGIFGFYLCFANLTWLANPLLIASWILVSRKIHISIITSLLASIICFSFLLSTKIIDNEGGYYSTITSYKLGYWLWVASNLSMLIGNCILYWGNLPEPVVE